MRRLNRGLLPPRYARGRNDGRGGCFRFGSWVPATERGGDPGGSRPVAVIARTPSASEGDEAIHAAAESWIATLAMTKKAVVSSRMFRFRRPGACGSTR